MTGDLNCSNEWNILWRQNKKVSSNDMTSKLFRWMKLMSIKKVVSSNDRTRLLRSSAPSDFVFIRWKESGWGSDRWPRIRSTSSTLKETFCSTKTEILSGLMQGQSICLSFSLSFFQSVFFCLSVCIFLCLSFFHSFLLSLFYFSVCLSVFLSFWFLSFCTSLLLSSCLPFFLFFMSICLSVCLSSFIYFCLYYYPSSVCPPVRLDLNKYQNSIMIHRIKVLLSLSIQMLIKILFKSNQWQNHGDDREGVGLRHKDADRQRLRSLRRRRSKVERNLRNCQ